MISRGKLIVLQGLDRSGKSTISKYVQEVLSGKEPTVTMNFPDRSTPIGSMINQFLNSKQEMSNEAVHLLFSANRWEKIKEIEETLKNGTNIICDRYWYSGVAYSVAKGMDFEWCLAADKGLHQPDLVIYLKAEPQVLSKRANFGEERFEKLQFQRKVKDSFERLFGSQKEIKVKTIETGELDLQQVKKLVSSAVLRLS